MELQASQVLQTGTVTLLDENGVPLYTVDYKPKATHFPTAAVSWNLAGSNKANDIDQLARVIRADGLEKADQLIFGVDAYELFISDPAIKDRLDNRRIEGNQIAAMQVRSSGGIYRGSVEIGNNRYDIWTYDGRYKDPQTGVSTYYLDPGKVIVRASSGRLDATFGGIPNFREMFDGARRNMFPEIPSRMTIGERMTDVHTNVWMDDSGENLYGGMGVRPLFIPTAIDTFGCLDTGV